MYPDDEELGTFPQWLYERVRHYAGVTQAWEDLQDDDWQYWEHEAQAVLRAARRGGFKLEPAQ